MERLVIRIGNEPAVPTEFDMDFVFDLDKGTFDGLQRIFNQLCDLTDILGDYDLARLRELVDADRDGRVKILSSTTGLTCGACDHFKRIPGTCRGRCSERPYCRNKYGHTDERRGEFTPSQSRIACKMFDRRKGPEVPDISDLLDSIVSGGEKNGGVH